MGVPPVRSGDVAFAQRDGVVQFGDYYEPRILTFQVSVDGDGCPGCAPEVLETFLLLDGVSPGRRSEEHTSELQSLMRISYAVFCLKKKTIKTHQQRQQPHTTVIKQSTTKH